MGRGMGSELLAACLSASMIAATSVADGSPGSVVVSAGNEQGGWIVMPLGKIGSALLHLPAADAPGTLIQASLLASSPVLLAARGDGVVMVFDRPDPTVQRDGVWSVREVRVVASQGTDRRYSQPTAMPPIPTRVTPTDLAAAGRTLAALVRDDAPPNALRLLVLSDSTWSEQPLPSGAADPHDLFASSGSLLLASRDAARNARRVWSFGSTHTEPAATWSTTPIELPIDSGQLFSIGGQIVSFETTGTQVEGSPADALLRVHRASGSMDLWRVSPSDQARWLVPMADRVAIVARETTDGLKMNCTVVAASGAAIYEGPVRGGRREVVKDFGALALVLSSLLTGVMAFVLRPEALRVDAVQLPEGSALAPPWKRLAAGFIDTLLAFAAAGIAWGMPLREWFFPTSWTDGPLGVTPLATALIVGACFGAMCEAAVGRSIGKALLRCRVLPARGGRLGLLQALARNVVRFLCPPLGMSWMLLPPEKQADVSGTIVVIDLPKPPPVQGP